jgi:hypothetical protein
VPIEEPANVGLRERLLTRADEYALQAVLWLGNAREGSAEEDKRRAQAAVAQALAVEPEHMMAKALELTFFADDDPRAFSAARLLSQRYPEHWLPWLLLGMTAMAGNERVPLSGPEGLEQVVSLAPWLPESWLVVAVQHALRGEHELALRLSKTALDMRPADLEALWGRAGILLAAHECAPMAQVISRIESQRLTAKGRQMVAVLKSKCGLVSASVSSGSTPE